MPQCASDINSITINNEATHVAASFDSKENNIAIWDIRQKDAITVDFKTCPHTVSSVIFAKNDDNTDLLICSSGNALYSKGMLESNWNKLISFKGNVIEKIEASSNGKSVAATCKTCVFLVSAENGTILRKSTQYINSIDGMAIISPDGTYCVWLKHLQQGVIFKKSFRIVKYSDGVLFSRYGSYTTEIGGKATTVSVRVASNEVKKMWSGDLSIKEILHRCQDTFKGNHKTKATESFSYWQKFKQLGNNAVETFKAYIRLQQ